jgi:hypothetical protein
MLKLHSRARNRNILRTLGAVASTLGGCRVIV